MSVHDSNVPGGVTIVASKFARFESSGLQHVGNTARERVQNTCHIHVLQTF